MFSNTLILKVDVIGFTTRLKYFKKTFIHTHILHFIKATYLNKKILQKKLTFIVDINMK